MKHFLLPPSAIEPVPRAVLWARVAAVRWRQRQPGVERPGVPQRYVAAARDTVTRLIRVRYITVSMQVSAIPIIESNCVRVVTKLDRGRGRHVPQWKLPSWVPVVSDRLFPWLLNVLLAAGNSEVQ
jgi:hypothetical protein